MDRIIALYAFAFLIMAGLVTGYLFSEALGSWWPMAVFVAGAGLPALAFYDVWTEGTNSHD